MKNFFKSSGVFLSSMPHFIVFELLFKLFMIAFGSPFLLLLLKYTMKISGVKYISDEKIWVYLKNPATFIALIIVLFFTAIFTFFELSSLTACFSFYSKGEKISVGGMFRAGFASLLKAFRKDGIISFLKFMLFMPLVQVTLSSGTFSIPMLPLLKNIFKSKGTFSVIIVYTALQLLLVFLIVNYSYSLHYLILTDKPLRECTRQSKKIINGRKNEQAFSVILWTLFMVAVVAVFVFALSFLILLFIKGFSNPKKALLSAVKVMKYAGKIFVTVSSFLVMPAIICRLTGKFFADIPETEKITLPDIKRSGLKKITRVAITTAVIFAGVALNYKYIDDIYKGNLNLNIAFFSSTQITAHRGFSEVAPENTMYAFYAAADSEADYIELDVQLTKDEQVVVFHDEKIDRVTDGKGKLSDYTYDELQEFSAGCRFRKSADFEDARIPLLSDVFDNIGDDVLYNIEIKDKGNSSLTTEKTIELIEEYGLEDSCYITSFSYNVLKNVKKINPGIKTGLISNSAIAHSFSQLNYIDALSLNYVFVNYSTVNTIHHNGKKVFVWTVNNTGDIQKMAALGVDNIITNRPDKAAEIIYSKSVSDRVLLFLKSVFSN